MTGGTFHVVPPRKRAPATPRVRRKKPDGTPRMVVHRVFGCGVLCAIRASESGDYFVAEVLFPDGARRTLQLAEAFWLTPLDAIMSLLPELPAPSPPRKRKAKAEPEEEGDEVEVEAERENLDGDGDDGDGEEEENEDDAEDEAGDGEENGQDEEE